MYIVHIMNLTINIWTLNFFIQIWKLIFQLWKLLFQLFKTLFEFENFDLNMIFSISIQKDLFDLKLDFELIFSNPKNSISIQKIINWS